MADVLLHRGKLLVKNQDIDSDKALHSPLVQVHHHLLPCCTVRSARASVSCMRKQGLGNNQAALFRLNRPGPGSGYNHEAIRGTHKTFDQEAYMSCQSWQKHLFQLVRCEVGGTGTGIEAGEAKIDCICSILHRCSQLGPAASRCQHLWLLKRQKGSAACTPLGKCLAIVCYTGEALYQVIPCGLGNILWSLLESRSSKYPSFRMRRCAKQPITVVTVLSEVFYPRTGPTCD